MTSELEYNKSRVQLEFVDKDVHQYLHCLKCDKYFANKNDLVLHHVREHGVAEELHFVVLVTDQPRPTESVSPEVPYHPHDKVSPKHRASKIRDDRIEKLLKKHYIGVIL